MSGSGQMSRSFACFHLQSSFEELNAFGAFKYNALLMIFWAFESKEFQSKIIENSKKI